MQALQVHTKDSAPESSVPLLSGAEQNFGFIPNLLGILAESPQALKSYLDLNQNFDNSSLSATERQVAILSISRFNRCEYCMAAHSAIAKMQGVPDSVVQAIREDQPIEDGKLEELRQFATAMLEARGWLENDRIQQVIDAGFTKAQVLEVILAISLKTLSNYVNHIAGTPLDSAFEAHKWHASE